MRKYTTTSTRGTGKGGIEWKQEQNRSMENSSSRREDSGSGGARHPRMGAPGQPPAPVRTVHQLPQRDTGGELTPDRHRDHPLQQIMGRRPLHQVAENVGIEKVHQSSSSTGRPVSRRRAA